MAKCWKERNAASITQLLNTRTVFISAPLKLCVSQQNKKKLVWCVVCCVLYAA